MEQTTEQKTKNRLSLIRIVCVVVFFLSGTFYVGLKNREIESLKSIKERTEWMRQKYYMQPAIEAYDKHLRGQSHEQNR